MSETKKSKKEKKSLEPVLSEEEARVRAMTEIVNEIIEQHKKKKIPNINPIRNRIQKKYKLNTGPKMVDILAAIPEQYKEELTPILKVKPGFYFFKNSTF
jgi:elongator complex protein 3